MYHRFGRIIFSTEGDGMTHFFFEDMFARDVKNFRPAGRAELAAGARKAVAARKQADRDFASYLDRDLDASFWALPQSKNPWFGRDEHDVAVPILRALAGLGTEKIAASAPARGAVAGFKDRTVLEFSQYVDAHGPRPAGKYEIPDCFHGLISGLATHQTLLGDAVATRDPRVLADALFAYPVQQNTKNARDTFRDLLTVHAKEIPAEFQAAKQYC
jgi:alpha-galactosidase/6-phospho-beta-glucosidase family protein